MSEPAANSVVAAPRKKSPGLMLWVAAAFLLLFAAWTTLFIVASKNPVQTVPLVKPAPAP